MQPPEVLYKKKVFLKISQNSQENTCARVSFLIKLQHLFHRTRLSDCFFHEKVKTKTFYKQLNTDLTKNPTKTIKEAIKKCDLLTSKKGWCIYMKIKAQYNSIIHSLRQQIRRTTQIYNKNYSFIKYVFFFYCNYQNCYYFASVQMNSLK